MKKLITFSTMFLLVCTSAACGDDEEVSSEAEARRAYFGLDRAIGLAMDLGFKGFNEAQSANIPAQTDSGQLRGTLNVTGQVDQGASDNKEMRLKLEMISYTDRPIEEYNKLQEVTYDTVTPQPELNLSLKDIPDGTLTGSLVGTFMMSGGLEGDVDLNLTMAGELEADPEDAAKVRRKPDTTVITGTATSDYGVFAVELTR